MLHSNCKSWVWIVGLIGTIFLAVFIFQRPLAWAGADMYRRLFPEQIPERPVYDDTASRPVNLAEFVRQSRIAWPDVSVSVVHHVAVQVAVGILLHADIVVGDMV